MFRRHLGRSAEFGSTIAGQVGFCRNQPDLSGPFRYRHWAPKAGVGVVPGARSHADFQLEGRILKIGLRCLWKLKLRRHWVTMSTMSQAIDHEAEPRLVSVVACHNSGFWSCCSPKGLYKTLSEKVASGICYRGY